MRAELESLEVGIGYAFHDRAILLRALTHTSHAYELRSQQPSPPASEDASPAPPPEPEPLGDNEQLEFLGDSILGFLISECLIVRYPDYREGRLSILKNFLVSATHLHEVAQKLELGQYLLLGRGEELSGGRVKRGLLADAVEALIAAIFLDSGIDAARSFVATHVFGAARELEKNADALFTNFKGALQEVARSLNLPGPRYSVISEHGPAHARIFTVEARIGDRWIEQAEGDSKKAAGQKAAQLILRNLLDQTG
jgi:ribonuclease III